jgi:hypothetical protein
MAKSYEYSAKDSCRPGSCGQNAICEACNSCEPKHLPVRCAAVAKQFRHPCNDPHWYEADSPGRSGRSVIAVLFASK